MPGPLYGLQFAGALPDLTTPAFAQVVLGALPLVVLVALVLWGAEYSRVARASDYHFVLENKINDGVDRPAVTWENWLRTGNTPPVDRLHYRLQGVGYVLTFYLLGWVGIYLFVVEVVIPRLDASLLVGAAAAAYVVVLALSYGWAGLKFREVLSPENSYGPELRDDEGLDRSSAPSTYDRFRDWRDRYSEAVLDRGSGAGRETASEED